MTSRPKVLYVAAVALAVMAAAGGCGGGGKKSTGPAPAGSVPTTTMAAASTAPATQVTVQGGGGGSGACRLVSMAEAAQLAGTAVQPGKEKSIPLGPGFTEHVCSYNFNPGNAAAVLVAVLEGRTAWDQNRQGDQSQSDFREVGGVGDEAYFAAGNLHVRKGDTGLTLDVGVKTGPPRGIKALDDDKRLAALVLPRV